VIHEERLLEFALLLLGEEVVNVAGEDAGFQELHHSHLSTSA